MRVGGEPPAVLHDQDKAEYHVPRCLKIPKWKSSDTIPLETASFLISSFFSTPETTFLFGKKMPVHFLVFGATGTQTNW